MSTCALHPFTEATHYCTGCERPLCEECGTHLSYCGACGAKVVMFGEEAPDHWVDTIFDHYVRGAGDGAGVDPAAFITLHAIVPAAIIGMVYSFLYYLLLVRSMFFGGTGALQWIGFLFVFATVLIVRYGTTRGDKTTQVAYSLVMLVATGMALMTRSESSGTAISSMLLLGIVWLYATGVTYALSLEGGREKSTHGAVAPVVALGAVAMLVFAVGEPFMLNASPEIAIQALLAIIVYLLSTAVALAAASTTSQARRAFRAGGDVALGVMPLRVGTAALIAVALMAVALTLPGVRYAGSGRIQQAPEAFLQQRPFSLGADPISGQIGEELIYGLPWGWLSGLEVMTNPSGQASAAYAVIWALQIAGAVVAAVVILAAIVFVVSRHSDKLGHLGPALHRYLAWLKRSFSSKVPEWARPSGPGRRRPTIDPFADIDALASRPAREAVVEVYLRSTVLLERLGHPRPPAATPYDLLGSLPERLVHLSDLLADITRLYVRAAYSDQEMHEEDRAGAIATLVAMRDRLAVEAT